MWKTKRYYSSKIQEVEKKVLKNFDELYMWKNGFTCFLIKNLSYSRWQ